VKDLRDWYRYLEVVARDPSPDSPARTPASESPRATRRLLKQETLPIDLGSSAVPRKKGGRRPLTETREEIIHRLMDPVLTLHEAAAILNLSKATVRRYTEQGKLSCQRTAGGQRRFRLSDVLAMLETTSSQSSQSSLSPQSEGNGRLGGSGR
jgi:excisionase family DNA binding protein